MEGFHKVEGNKFNHILISNDKISASTAPLHVEQQKFWSGMQTKFEKISPKSGILRKVAQAPRALMTSIKKRRQSAAEAKKQ